VEPDQGPPPGQGVPPPPPPGDTLQFDQAEYSAPVQARECTSCKQPITTAYFEVNGQIMCPACRDAVLAAFTGGSGTGRFLRASMFGGVVAILCSILWYAVVKFTGYQIGLIAVVVGYAVGASVRKGSGHRGGWLYQLLAVFLTYAAITGSYVPMLLADLAERRDERQASVSEPTRKPAAGDAAFEDTTATESAEGSSTAEIADDASSSSQTFKEDFRTLSPGKRAVVTVLFLVAVVIASMVAPFFGGIIGILIIGFALWEAWRMNRRLQINITGPYSLGAQ
jgi:hypothetical protein